MRRRSVCISGMVALAAVFIAAAAPSHIALQEVESENASGQDAGEPPLPTDQFHRGIDPDQPAQVAPDFNRDIRPILAANCYLCHGPDPSTRKADMRLDTRDHATAPRAPDGGGVIVPGEPDQSVLLDRISAHDPLDRMPPDGRTPLSAEQVDLIRRWIAAGAPYDQHWSLKPVADPPTPAVGDESWPLDDVDRFILARLESADLTPAPSTDKRTLLRRVTFDLIGLPPTREEIDDFLNDDSPDAYERVVDRLLDSPHFGERWGRHRLDLMRYAETHGHEYDYPIRYAWQYRDYVIRALNADVPYDDFVREHIAGDLMDPPRRHPTDGYNESIIGTGWWWLSQGTHAPVDVRADEAERMDNQIDVLSKSFLGLTVSCARCHDHKFDPITQQDFYALAGYIQSSRRQEAFLDPHGRIESSVNQLNEKRDGTTTLIREGLSGASTEQLPSLIAAALEAMEGEPQPGDADIEPSFIVFDDFEGETYDGWTVAGTAFGPGPYTQEVLAEYQGNVGGHGRGFVNTHNTRNGEDVAQADEHLGSMTSEPFTIEHRFIHFLIGGGDHEGKTCINLLVDDEIVRTATGRRSNRMHRARWDVGEFVGREAHLEILDQESGGWGQIGIDHIVFSDDESLPPATRRPIEAVAREHDVEIEDVITWVRAMAAPPRGELNDAAPEDAFATFDDGSFGSWMPTGHAFGDAPGRTGERIGATSRFLDADAAHSGMIAPTKLGGALRSPTFELTRPYINYRVRGTGGRIRVTIDGYFLDDYNPLIFDGITFPVDSPDQWTIHAQQIIPKYIGHRAHIEIQDEGDGWIEVDWIAFSDEPMTSALVAASDSEPSTIAQRADQLASALQEAASCVGGGECDHAHHVQHVTWLFSHDLIELPNRDRCAAALESEQQIAGSIPDAMRVLAICDGTPEDEYVFIRGSHRNAGPTVPRRFLSVLGGEANEHAAGSGRLALADDLFDEANPLPARVAVNRVWLHLFGKPIVPTPDDFGLLGQSPTHPELLDHLATWFRDEAEWSTKQLIRRLVLTQTYRMSSDALDERAGQIDPTITLCHRMSVKRLEGEAIRDALLAVSGRLDETMFGPPVPLHLTPFMQGRGRPGESGPIDGDGRRSIYLSVRRNFLSPMMLAFDTPVPHSTVGRRNVSNVPAQALILMNDPLVVQQAGRWAKRVLGIPGLSPGERIDRMYVEAFGRPPTLNERDAAMEFLKSSTLEGADWMTHEPAWADLGHVLFNVKEFIFVR